MSLLVVIRSYEGVSLHVKQRNNLFKDLYNTCYCTYGVFYIIISPILSKRLHLDTSGIYKSYFANTEAFTADMFCRL